MAKALLDLPIAELKRRLANETDFALSMLFFSDNFADDRAFMDASYPGEVPKALSQAVGRVFANFGCHHQDPYCDLKDWRRGSAQPHSRHDRHQRRNCGYRLGDGHFCWAARHAKYRNRTIHFREDYSHFKHTGSSVKKDDKAA